MKKMNIRTRLALAFSFIIILIVILFLEIGVQYYSIMGNYQEIIERYDAISYDIARISAYTHEANGEVVELVHHEALQEEEIREHSQSLEDIDQKIKNHNKDLAEVIDGTGLEEDYDNIAKNIEKEKKAIQSILEAVATGDVTTVQRIYKEEYKTAADNNVEFLERVNEESENQALQMQKQSEKDSKSVLIAGILLILALIILTVIIEVFTIRAIRVPLEEVVRVVKRLAEGDISARAEKIYHDEIGEVADAVNALAEKNTRAAGIAHKISKGDLTMEVSPETDMDVLGKSFKELVDGNNTTLGEIRDAAAQVGAGSNQVAVASQSLAQGSTQQASAVQQVTASINDITTKTKVNAQHANHANELVIQTKENAMQGTVDMQNMMHAMDEINESSENISKIIKTIDDIAFQTNILALNAAVEAARAGEHGKGFSVVAEEVRGLAAKSAEAASETAEMIEDSMQKVRNGAELAKLTSDKLEDIVSSVEQIVSLTQEIADASNDQANVLEQIDQAIEQVSQVVQTNSATSEQCAAASEELSNQAKNLKSLVEKYKLRTMGIGQTTQAPTNFGMPVIPEVPIDFSKSNHEEPETPQSFGQDFSVHTSGNIPDASDFISETDTKLNEQIISLEDNTYSKY